MDDLDTGTDGWSVGELARATGVSVRVLRHWDGLGVVSPRRSAAGHRRYGPAEVVRLYRALALRRTGLRLDRIAALLADADPDPTATLRAHLAELDADIARRTALRDRLRTAVDGNAAPLTKVIETMTMVDGYVHGYRPREGERLGDQAAVLAGILHAGTTFAPGSRVLEVGCGVGAQTVELLRRSPGVHVTAVDRTRSSLAQARRRIARSGVPGAAGSTVEFVADDVVALPRDTGPLRAGAFDHVFVCFLLEHLPDPRGALARMREMLVPGGTITVIEGDHGQVTFHPDSAVARRAIACQTRLQAQAGGDALIGRRLGDLLAGAGFTGTTLRPCVMEVDASSDPRGVVDGFIRDCFTAMIAGVREPTIAAGLMTVEEFDAGVADLLATARPGGRFRYTFTKAVARVG